MSNCPNCGAAIAPNSRFCTECGKPLAAAGPAPMPPAPQPVRPPMPGQPMGMPPGVPGGMPPAPTGMPPVPPAMGGMPPRPAMPPTGMPPAPTGMPPAPQPGMRPAPAPMPMPPAPQPVAPQPMVPQPMMAPAPQPMVPAPAPMAQAAAATLPAAAAYKFAATGDLLNNGSTVAMLITEEQLTVMVPGAAPIVEPIPNLKHAIVGDYDGDGFQELAVFNDTHVWVLRFSVHGSVPSGKAAVSEMPEHLTKAPFTHDGGRTVLMSATTEKVRFYVLHPSRGLVEIASAPVPFIEP